MNALNIADLKPDTYFSSDVFLDKKFFLLPPSTPLTAQMITALQDWSFTEVFCDEIVESTPVEEILATEPDVNDFIEEVATIVSNESIGQLIVEAEASKTTGDETTRFNAVKRVYDEYIEFIDGIYTKYATHRTINYREISDVTKNLCIFISKNRRTMLRITFESEYKGKNFLLYHSMRSTVIALVIGLQLNIQLSRLTEIGVACILHEIGMIKLPSQMYMSDRKLTAVEKKAIFTHPILSYDIIRTFDFPLTISTAVLNHHEKEDGSGYPRKILGKDISLYAKIISVACSFEAITASRQHRDAASSHEAMVEMLQNTGKQYDDMVIKALLHSFSLFPIGSYVYLSNGKIGLTVETNPENPRNPIVQLLNETTEDGKEKFIKTGENGITIVRAFTKAETLKLLKTMEIKKRIQERVKQDTMTGNE